MGGTAEKSERRADEWMIAEYLRLPEGNERETLREDIVKGYSPLVYKIARKFVARLSADFSLELEDLVLVGCEGIVCALDSYKPEKGVKFITFAMIRTEWYIRNYLRNSSEVGPGMEREIRKYYRKKKEIEERLGRTPDIEEIQGCTGYTPKKIGHIENALAIRGALSLDEKRRGKNGIEFALGDIISDKKDIYNSILLKIVVEDGIKRLSPRSREAFVLYYIDGLKLREIGKMMGCTPSNVGGLLKKGTRKIREYLQLEEVCV